MRGSKFDPARGVASAHRYNALHMKENRRQAAEFTSRITLFMQSFQNTVDTD